MFKFRSPNAVLIMLETGIAHSFIKDRDGEEPHPQSAEALARVLRDYDFIDF